MYFRQPRRLMVMTGPPYDESRDAEYAAVLDAFPGRKAICGGTTADFVAWPTSSARPYSPNPNATAPRPRVFMASRRVRARGVFIRPP